MVLSSCVPRAPPEDLESKFTMAAFTVAFLCPALRAVSSSPGSTRCTSLLTEANLHALSTAGFCIAPGCVDASLTGAIRRDILDLDAAGATRMAAVGSRGNVALDQTVRRSRSRALFPPPPVHVGNASLRRELLAFLEALRLQLNAAIADGRLRGVLHLAPFETEASYLSYDAGGYYKAHLDVPRYGNGWLPASRRPEDGTSLRRWERRREVSVLLYVNEAWCVESMGGALRIHSPASDEAGESPDHGVAASGGVTRAAAADAAAFHDIEPRDGTLVVMRSPCVKHEVLTSAMPRQCVAAWFAALRSDGAIMDAGGLAPPAARGSEMTL